MVWVVSILRGFHNIDSGIAWYPKNVLVVNKFRGLGQLTARSEVNSIKFCKTVLWFFVRKSKPMKHIVL